MKVEYKGVKVHYDFFGAYNTTNQTILFLHGWGCEGRIFLSLINDLKHFYNCFVIDFPPFGNSGEPLEPWTLEDYVKIVKMVLEEENVQKVAIFAHSFGARVAIKFVSCYNNCMNKGFPQVTHILLTGGAGMKPRRHLKYYLKVWFYKIFKKFLKNKKVGSEDYKKLSPIMKKTFINIVNTHLEQIVKDIQIPALLLWGQNDFETPIYMAKRLNRLLQNSKLEIFSKVGHYCFLEKKEEFFDKIIAFFK